MSITHRFVSDLIGLCLDCNRPEPDPVHQPRTAAAMNATGSPTGRVTRDAPATSVEAAEAVPTRGHRQIILTGLVAAGVRGLTSIEAAALLPLTRHGGPQVSNRSASRLGELWEAGQATIARTWGTCTLGVCHRHDKPVAIHKPTAPCAVHGTAQVRDGASVWVAVAHTPNR